VGKIAQNVEALASTLMAILPPYAPAGEEGQVSLRTGSLTGKIKKSVVLRSWYQVRNRIEPKIILA
jgi:hypothetical protein